MLKKVERNKKEQRNLRVDSKADTNTKQQAQEQKKTRRRGWIRVVEQALVFKTRDLTWTSQEIEEGGFESDQCLSPYTLC